MRRRPSPLPWCPRKRRPLQRPSEFVGVVQTLLEHLGEQRDKRVTAERAIVSVMAMLRERLNRARVAPIRTREGRGANELSETLRAAWLVLSEHGLSELVHKVGSVNKWENSR